VTWFFVRTDISQERIASIIMVKTISKLETMLAVTTNLFLTAIRMAQSMQQLATGWTTGRLEFDSWRDQE
jgi:hypothetical protein